ncbi:DinI-like family protein [Escherichia coli]|nr:DinI-like family protein [Escherichia coli]
MPNHDRFECQTAIDSDAILHLYPKTVIRIRKGSSNGVELTGLQLDEERKQVMKIMQKVWEDDSWLH